MDRVLIKSGRLFDGVADHAQPQRFLTVRGGLIEAMGAQTELGGEDGRFSQVLDLGVDTTVLPGLINMHTHMSASADCDAANIRHDLIHDGAERLIVRSVNNLREALHCGITTVRDCGTLNAVAFAVRQAAEEGLIDSPRVIAAGNGITTTAGHCWFFSHEADSAHELRKAVREQVKQGADFIKFFATGGRLTPGSNVYAAQYTEAELIAGAEEARRLGKTSASHALGTPGIHGSIAAGVTTIEHCIFLAPGQNGEDRLAYEPETARRIADKGIYVVPTLFMGVEKFKGQPGFNPTPAQQAFFDARPERFRLTVELVEAGVRLASGSDAGMSHVGFGDYPEDLILTGEGCGLSPVYVLKSATSVAAEALHREDIGVLAPGKSADLLAVQGNPLENLRALKQASHVMVQGRLTVLGTQ